MNRTTTPVDDLAMRILKRSGMTSPGPYILFLGEGCARAAGVPELPQLARTAMKLFGSTLPEGSNDEKVTEAFFQQIQTMKPAHVARMLDRLFATTPIPTFYQYLAQLVRERFFPLILTTSYDTFLEQALSNTGLRQTEYRVTTFGQHMMSSSTSGNPNHFTHIVKLHGDIAREVVHLTPEQVQAALSESRQFIKAELRGDLILVGYSFADEQLNRWLMHEPQRELWWVAPESPTGPQFQMWTNDPHVISGEESRPQIFFSKLATRLLQPGQFGLKVSDEEDSYEGLESLASVAPPEPPADEEPLADVLQSEIRRAQGVLSSLEQEAPPELRPPAVQAQIAYQKKAVSRLEEKMRTLPEVKPKLIAIMDLINASVHRSSMIAPDVQIYLDSQIATVKSEMEKDSPNPFLVSASLGATLTMADRLCTEFGSDVVNPDYVRELASFAPMVAAKVVL